MFGIWYCTRCGLVKGDEGVGFFIHRRDADDHEPWPRRKPLPPCKEAK